MPSSLGFTLSLPAHTLSSSAIEQELATDLRHGLSNNDAKLRLKTCGKNTLDDASDVKPFKTVAKQISNPIAIVLLGAMVASFGAGFWIEGAIIAVVVILNVIIGASQEIMAKKQLRKFRSFSLPTASVIRAGITTRTLAEELVPGDIVNLKSGDTVPADVRLIKSINLETNEALLTGESLLVRKDDKVLLDADTSPRDRLNIAFYLSTITQGSSRGVVFATGARTEVGMVVSALQFKGKRRKYTNHSRQAPVDYHHSFSALRRMVTDSVCYYLGINVSTALEIWLSKLATLLFAIAIVCALITFAVNNKSSDTREVVMYAVATGLSIIPISLTVVLVITLAAGIKKMVKRHVVVHKLHALEGLGSVTDICLDKTGTLTQAKMLAKIAWIPAKGSYISRGSNDTLNPEAGDLLYSHYSPVELHKENREQEIVSNPVSLAQESVDLESFLTTASLVSPAYVRKRFYSWVVRGDPTDIAIQIFAYRFGWGQERLICGKSPEWTQIVKFPFDSVNKKMSAVFTDRAGKSIVCTKGAVEHVLKSCTHVNWGNDQGVVRITAHLQSQILGNMECLAAQGFRVLAFASKEANGDFVTLNLASNRPEVEHSLTFQGIVGLFDSERLDSTVAVRRFHRAGIAVRMLTGDHLGTAEAIALHVGILPRDLSTQAKTSAILIADSFDKLTDDEIDSLPTLPLVVARCLPSTKVRMIEALQRRRRLVAMVGDGINDAQAMKQANIGIAMSQSSDAVKGVSDMVLTNDSLTSILHGIKEGRRMFDNIEKFVRHLLAENIAQACVLLVGLVFKDNLGISVFPLATVEILWIVMVTSALPDMGLGFEVAAQKIMRRPSRASSEGVLTVEVGLDVLIYGLWMAALCIAAFSVVLFGFGDGDLASGCNRSYSLECGVVFRARATTFICLVWFALILSWEMIDKRCSLFCSGQRGAGVKWVFPVWKNKFLFWAVITGFVTVFPTLYIPVVNHVIFKHDGISWEWVIVIVESIIFLAGVEVWKLVKRAFVRSRMNATRLLETEVSLFAGLSENEGVKNIVVRGAVQRSQDVEML